MRQESAFVRRLLCAYSTFQHKTLKSTLRGESARSCGKREKKASEATRRTLTLMTDSIRESGVTSACLLRTPRVLLGDAFGN